MQNDRRHSRRVEPSAHRREIVVPANLAPEADRFTLIGCEHRLEVDLVLNRGAMRNLGEHLPPVAVGDQIELEKRFEEMNERAAVLGGGYEIPAGERVDRQVAECVVVDRAFRRPHALRGIARRRDDGERRVDAVAVFERVVDVTLGVDGTGQMVVQVAALGHSLEEVEQSLRITVHGGQICRGAVRGGGVPRHRCRHEDEQQRRGEESDQRPE
jgi:hypothetical protein